MRADFRRVLIAVAVSTGLNHLWLSLISPEGLFESLWVFLVWGLLIGVPIVFAVRAVRTARTSSIALLVGALIASALIIGTGAMPVPTASAFGVLAIIVTTLVAALWIFWVTDPKDAATQARHPGGED